MKFDNEYVILRYNCDTDGWYIWGWFDNYENAFEEAEIIRRNLKDCKVGKLNITIVESNQNKIDSTERIVAYADKK